MIPNELKQVANWCVYKLVANGGGKPKKIPINAKNGSNAQSNNTETWCDYETAKKAVGVYGDGLGFFFSPPYFGVDIDGIEADIKKYKEGDTDNIVSEFVHSLQSYAELSVSGNGIHVICRGELPEGARRKGNVEMYSSGRYFIMTGNSLGEYEDINECTEPIKYLHSKYLSSGVSVKSPVLTDDKVLELALNSKQGQAFKTLYDGLWQGLYPSQSEADLAFCNMLSFWCGRDKFMMDTIFRRSGLMREKWLMRRGTRTYGEMVLNRAIVDCKEVFVPGEGIEDYSISIGAPTVKRYAYDDTGNADRFVDLFSECCRYSYIDKNWYFYNGKKWEFDNEGLVKKLTEKMITSMRKERTFITEEDVEKAFDKHMKYTRGSRGKENALKESQHRLSILPSAMDSQTDKFNCSNGVIDLRKGVLQNHKYDEYMAKISNVEYTDKIDCPMWLEFLSVIFAGDTELIEYVQKAVGYSMTGSTREQAVFFLYGHGRNGKSTFLDIIHMIMGDYGTNIQPETIMVKPQQGSANSDIARLKGARFVTTVEPDEGARIKEGLLKQLTGGDIITARHLYGREFEFRPEFKIWMATNHKPIIRGRDLGIWRRMHMIPFNVEIPENKVDKNLKYKLSKELTGILNWAVEGCIKWQTEGLTLPAVVSQAVEEYRSEMDVITSFLKECTTSGSGEVKASDLYKAYTEWASENNEYKMSNTKFGREISLRFRKRKSMYGWMYDGLVINDEYYPYGIRLYK